MIDMVNKERSGRAEYHKPRLLVEFRMVASMAENPLRNRLHPTLTGYFHSTAVRTRLLVYCRWKHRSCFAPFAKTKDSVNISRGMHFIPRTSQATS